MNHLKFRWAVTGATQVISVTRAHHTIYFDWLNKTVRRLRHWNFHLLSFWRVLSLLCDVTLCYKKWEILLISFPLFSDVRHRAMITPVCPPLTRIIHISPSYWTIYRLFEIILEMVTVHRIELQIQRSIQAHCFKKHSVRYELCFKKYLTAWEISDSNGWARVKREWTKSREHLLRTTLFYSDHLQHERERPDMKRKYMNSDKVQRKEPELTTYWSGTVGGGTNIQSKLAFSDINRNQRLGLSPGARMPESPLGC